RDTRSCSGCWRWSASSPSLRAWPAFRNLRAALSNSATILLCPRSICTAFRHGLSASPLRPSASVRWYRPRSCRSQRRISIRAISIANSSIEIPPTGMKRRWRNGCSLIVKFGALVFILFVPSQYAIYMQLLGGILIIQTLPAVLLGVYTRWFNDWALLVGWAVGTAVGTWMFVAANLTPNFPLAIGGYTFPGYSALYTVILNLLVTIVLTPVFNA